MKKEFNINISVRPKYVETFKVDSAPRPLSKKDSISLKNRIENMRQIREQELSSSLDINPGGLNITVTPQVKGWIDKKDHRGGRTGRSELERRSIYRWKSPASIEKIQEKLAMNR